MQPATCNLQVTMHENGHITVSLVIEALPLHFSVPLEYKGPLRTIAYGLSSKQTWHYVRKRVISYGDDERSYFGKTYNLNRETNEADSNYFVL